MSGFATCVRIGPAPTRSRGVDRARNENVRACFFMQDVHRVSGADVARPDEKSESPPPGWARTRAATAAAETAAAPTEVARKNRHRSDRLRPSDDHVGATDVDSLSTLANVRTSRAQAMHGPQTPR